MLHEQIKSGIKEAMLAKDALKLKAFRAMSAAFTYELGVKGKTPQDMLSDEEAIAVINKLAKQRKDSIEQFKKGNREDLVKEEQAELDILETYLPKLMDKSEGMLMSAIMKDLKGKADGMVVKEVVDSLF